MRADARTTCASGTPRAACSATDGEPFAARRPARPTTSASSATSACACATTGQTACARSSAVSSAIGARARAGRSPTPTTTACAAARACRAVRPTPASRRRTPTSSRPGPCAACWSCAPTARVERVLIEDARRHARGDRRRVPRRRRQTHSVAAGAVVVAGGALNTPRCCWRARGSRIRCIGRHLGFHPARLVVGYFDELQDAHIVYPITAHCAEFQRDEDGGFVVEAVTMQDPIGFAIASRTSAGPMWGAPLVEALRQYRHWTGLLAMVNDENNGTVCRRRRPRRVTPLPVPSEPAPTDRVRFSSPRGARGGGRRAVLSDRRARPTSRAAAGWAPTRRARSSTRTASRTRQAAVRRRRLGDPADAVGEPIADDHVAGEPARRVPDRRRATATSRGWRRERRRSRLGGWLPSLTANSAGAQRPDGSELQPRRSARNADQLG